MTVMNKYIPYNSSSRPGIRRQTSVNFGQRVADTAGNTGLLGTVNVLLLAQVVVIVFTLR